MKAPSEAIFDLSWTSVCGGKIHACYPVLHMERCNSAYSIIFAVNFSFINSFPLVSASDPESAQHARILAAFFGAIDCLGACVSRARCSCKCLGRHNRKALDLTCYQVSGTYMHFNCGPWQVQHEIPPLRIQEHHN